MNNSMKIILAVSLYALAACKGDGKNLTSIVISPPGPIIAVGTTKQFSALGIYSDNSTQDLTAYVNWRSSNMTIATVNNSTASPGMATAINVGKTTILASVGTITANATLTAVSITMTPNKLVFSQTALVHTDFINNISSINYIVYTKPGNNSKNLNVTYSLSYLTNQGFVDYDNATVEVPIFGLYPGYLNNIAVLINWTDKTSTSFLLNVQTDEYASKYALHGIQLLKQYKNPTVSYMLIDSYGTSPIVMDIDGEVRWQSDIVGESYKAYLDNIESVGGFLVFDKFGSGIKKINFKGQVVQSNDISDANYYGFHHNVEPGKEALLAGVNFHNGDIIEPKSVLIEVTPLGDILESWDFNQIIGDKIRKAGENPSTFMMNGVDWFHMNSNIYSPQDDSLIVSSRENFVIKVDYATKDIKWILGNADKQWYQNYPLSLRPLAMRVRGKAPIGQHSLSLPIDANHLLLLNNGHGSDIWSDAGDSESRAYSAVSVYEINEAMMTADEVFTLTFDEKLLSPYCGSVYKTEFEEYLIDFASVANQTYAKLMVVDGNGHVNLDMRIPKRSVDDQSCDTVYRVKPIKLESFTLK